MATTIPPKGEKQPLPSGAGSTTCSAERAPAANLTPPPPRLPPGVYFSPTKAESILTYLNRWIAGAAMPDAARWIVEADVYGEDPDALARKHRPASTRDAEPSWWFLCHCKLQAARGGRTRGDRRVATGGYWKLEQTSQAVACEVSGKRLGFKRSFGFYVSHGRAKQEDDERPKTRWLMEEYTSVACPEDGIARADGKKVLPALYRMYITVRDPDNKENNKNKKRGREDDDDGAHTRDGNCRSMVPAAYFDAVAALLSSPPSRVLGVGKEQTKEDAQEAPPEPRVFDLSNDITARQTGRGDGVPVQDCSWIGHHYET